jgi:hypothetical protein
MPTTQLTIKRKSLIPGEGRNRFLGEISTYTESVPPEESMLRNRLPFYKLPLIFKNTTQTIQLISVPVLFNVHCCTFTVNTPTLKNLPAPQVPSEHTLTEPYTDNLEPYKRRLASSLSPKVGRGISSLATYCRVQEL